MEKNELEKFKRHIGQPVEVVIGGDKFKFKPLNYEQYGKLLTTSAKMQKNGKIDSQELNPESVKAMMELFVDIVKTSYPELDEETAEQFVIKNSDVFGDVIEKLVPKTEKGDIDKIKSRLKNTKEKIDGSK